MWLEEAGRSRINLREGCQLRLQNSCQPYVEFIQLCLNTLRRMSRTRQEKLCDRVDDTDFIRAEIDRESRAIHLCGLAIRIIEYILAVVSETSRLTGACKSCEGVVCKSVRVERERQLRRACCRV